MADSTIVPVNTQTFPSALSEPAELVEGFWLQLEGQAATRADETALLAPTGDLVTYATLWRRVLSLEHDLASSGIARGDRVVVLLPTGVEMFVVLLGVMHHCACIPLSPRLAIEELRHNFERICPAAVMIAAALTQEEFIQQMEICAICAELSLEILEWNGNSIKRTMPASASKDRKNAPRPSAPHPNVSARRSSDQQPFFRSPEDEGRPILYLFTSATSGRAKIAPHTERSLGATFWNTIRALKLTTHDRLLLFSSLFYAQGIISSMAQLMAGGVVIVTNGFDETFFEEQLQNLRPTWFTCGPTVHRAILGHLERHPLQRPTSLRFMRSSGAPLAPDLIRGITRALNAPLLEAYGLSETGAVTTMTPELFENMLASDPRLVYRSGLVGRSIGPEIAILRNSHKRAVENDGQIESACRPTGCGPDDREGEILVRGPSVISGYLDDHLANEEAFLDGWFRTGDFGYLDDEGFLFITGRIKEIVDRGGQKILPNEVEAVLATHPSVAEVAVFPIAHPTLGEDVACAVVLKGICKLHEVELRHFASQRLSFYKIPRWVFVVEAIPRGSTGKPQRRVLADRYRSVGLSRGDQTLIASRSERELSGGAGTLLSAERPTSPTQLRIHEIWRRLLRSENVSIDADFFAAGGDSLMAMVMLREIDLEFHGETVKSAARFFDEPTILTIAAILQHRDGLAAASVNLSEGIVPLPARNNRDKSTLFCIPDDGGEGLYFRRLSRHLGDKLPLSILRPGETLRRRPDTIELAAKEVVAAVLAERTGDGPFLIAGFCYGGLIAYEASRILEERGYRTALLLFDVPLPGFPGPFRQWTVLGRWLLAGTRSGQNPRAVVPIIVNALRCVRRLGWFLAVPVRPAFEALWRHKSVRILHHQICGGYLPLYRPQSTDAALLHFFSSDDPKPLRVASREGWKILAKSGVQTKLVPGNHEAMFQEMNLPRISGEILTWLGREGFVTGES